MVPGILALTGFLLVLFVQPPLLRCNEKGWDYVGDLVLLIKKQKKAKKKTYTKIQPWEFPLGKTYCIY